MTFDHGTFSTPAEAGAGFLRLLDDPVWSTGPGNAAGTNLYLIAVTKGNPVTAITGPTAPTGGTSQGPRQSSPQINIC